MMNVNLMNRFIEPNDQMKKIVTDFSCLWNCDENTLELERVSANCIFYFEENGKGRFLRIAHESERRIEQIESELDFINHLKVSKISVLNPMASKNNNLIETTIANNEKFYAVVFEEMLGQELDIEEMNEKQLFEWGKSMALFHEAVINYIPNENIQKRSSMKDDILNAIDILNAQDELEVKDKLLEFKKWVDCLEKRDNNYGIIHYDFETDNLLWENDKYNILDIDDSRYYFFTADIAFALGDIRDFEDSLSEKVLNKFIEGYTLIRKLEKKWKNEVNNFFFLMDILKYSKILNAYKNSNPDNDLPWLSDMRKRHTNSLERLKKRILLCFIII